jgi:hypothetical protein
MYYHANARRSLNDPLSGHFRRTITAAGASPRRDDIAKRSRAY